MKSSINFYKLVAICLFISFSLFVAKITCAISISWLIVVLPLFLPSLMLAVVLVVSVFVNKGGNNEGGE